MRVTGKIGLLFFLFLMAVYSSAENEYQLVWAEEFNYNGRVDSSRWSYENFPPGTVNNELQHYTDELKNVEVKDGLLYITALKEGEKITSGRIITKDKASWLYGKIEARILLPKAGEYGLHSG